MTAALTNHQTYQCAARDWSRPPVGRLRPLPAVFVYRRLGACVVLALLGLGALLGARTVLADRGAVPASSAAIRLSSAQQAVLPTAQQAVVPTGMLVGRYLVQPGDTLWSVAQRFHGSVDVADYVDRLVASHGDTSLQVGDIIPLP